MQTYPAGWARVEPGLDYQRLLFRPARCRRSFVPDWARIEAEGAEIIANTPDQALAVIRADLDKWAAVIRRTGIRAN